MRRLLVVLVTVAASSLAACSDDEPSGSPPGAGFAEQADGDCRKANEMLAAAVASSSARPQQFQTVADTVRTLLRDIDALVPSDAEQENVYQLLDGLRAIETAAQTAAQSLAKGDDPGATSATFRSATSSPKASVATAAQELRIPNCADLPLPASQ